MNGGAGPLSYAQNSSYQRGAIEAAEALIRKEIAANIEIRQPATVSFRNPFRIVDLGCSSGPNTVLAIRSIVDALEQKFKSCGLKPSQLPEFQVFFNDYTDNDFNALFALLPPERSYFAAGVPGSFFGSLFPKESLHFAYSSCALCWLSTIPRELEDINSVAFNRGRIHYTGASQEVFEAYSAQYKRDIKSFLRARAGELVSEGLMTLIVPGVPDGFLQSQSSTGSEFDLLGSCLVDMAKEGVIEEKEVDTFNLPIYYTCPRELQRIILEDGDFNTETMEVLDSQSAYNSMPELGSRILYLRAVLEGVLQKHFRHEIMDELFERYRKKLVESPFFMNPQTHRSIMIFVLLKRK